MSINTHKYHYTQKLRDYNGILTFSAVLMDCKDHVVYPWRIKGLKTKHEDTIDEMLVGGLRLVINSDQDLTIIFANLIVH